MSLYFFGSDVPMKYYFNFGVCRFISFLMVSPDFVKFYILKSHKYDLLQYSYMFRYNFW